MSNALRSCPVVSYDHRSAEWTEPRLRRLYSQLHDAPLTWSDAHGGFWIVARHADVRALEMRPAEFSNAACGVAHPPFRTERSPVPALEQDPPEQAAPHRKYVSWFSGKRLAAAEQKIRELTAHYVGAFATAGGGDFAREVSEKLPVEIVCHLLGIGHRAVEFRALSHRLSCGDATAVPELLSGMGAELQARRREPGDDLLSELMAEGIGGEMPTYTFLTSFTIGALTAGHETTLIAGTGLMYELARDPAVQERLAADPDLIRSAVDEALRLHAPAQNFFRTLTKDVVLHGEQLRAGDRVMLQFAAANLDPAAFEAPIEFTLGRRDSARHLSFGHGVHRCAGSALAELELRILAETALPYRFRLNGDVGFGTPTAQGSFLGFTRLPLVPSRPHAVDGAVHERLRNLGAFT